jgi:hypothetical protein
MNWILITAVVLAFAISLIADYKWRRWMEARKAERQAQNDPSQHPGPR